MKSPNSGLILEGGGLRGLFTAGVLDCFLKHDLHFPYVIGVSAGAVMGTSYISRQPGRNRTTTINYVNDKRYLSFRNLLKEGSIFGMDFIFNRLPNILEPFDYDVFFNNPVEYKIGCTDCITGQPVFFDKNNCSKKELMHYLVATSSIPLLSRIVDINGKKLLDGGISNAIPFEQSLKDGIKKGVVVLTRNHGYRKTAIKTVLPIKLKYRQYPKIAELMQNRHHMYNSIINKIETMEKKNEVMVVRPQSPIQVGRLEKNKQKLQDLYEEGYNECENRMDNIKEWLSS